MVAAVVSRFERLDILVNNAGIRFVKPFLEYTEEEWRKTLDVNLTGLFLCCRAAVPHMLRGGKGKIVNVASVAGEFGRPHRIGYCASKGGAIAFTKALAVDMSGKNICVNALSPALIDTPLNAAYATDDKLADVWGKELLVRRWGRPEDVAAAAIYLASDDSDFVTGSVLTVDGGWTAGLVRANELDWRGLSAARKDATMERSALTRCTLHGGTPAARPDRRGRRASRRVGFRDFRRRKPR